MRKLTYVGNILSALPSLLVVPLVPFIFILIDGEGKIPGFFHEYSLRTLMVAYPLILLACFFSTLRLLKTNKERLAAWISFIPLGVFGLLVAVYVYGGVVLR
ncbi:MAG: hypothetical protein KTR18_16125 [Acidiferrobacterales bacterium]|nr:hypothetical protein [Acidiferrobacterales bacterium]